MNLSNRYVVSLVAKNIIVYILAFLCISCSTFKRNPNLRLLLKEEGYSLLNPRWTKDDWIYYTKCEVTEAYIEYGVGEVWRIEDDGDNNELICSGTFSIIDISPSETLLVGIMSDDPFLAGPIVLYNFLTTGLETLYLSAQPDVGLKFSATDIFIYFYNNGLHRVNIYTLMDTVISFSSMTRFDIYKDSLLFYVDISTPLMEYIVDIVNSNVLHQFPSFAPGPGIFFVPYYPDSLIRMGERQGIEIYALNTSEKSELDAAPEEIAVWAEFGNCIDFDTSGKKIVFGATGDVSESGNAGPFELWILEKF